MNTRISIEVNGQPDPELTKANRIEVHERLGETTYYSLQYPEDIVEGDLKKLSDPRFNPSSVLSVTVYVDNAFICLVRGPVFSQRVQLQHGGEGSTLEVHGADSSILMDREFRSLVWPDNVTDSDVVTNIVSNYGLQPDVDTTNTRHLENKHLFVQRETDLQLIRRLARRNGFYFWLTAENPVTETARFKRLQLGSTPVADLIINGPNANIQMLTLQFDVERPTSISGLQMDLNTKNIINGDTLQSVQQNLGEKSLSAITGDTRSTQLAPPVDDAADMLARGEAVLAESDWFIHVNCSTSIHKLKKVLRASDIVNIDGAGSRHSGKYLVSAVKHVITDDDHIMDLALVRNGWL